jgi:hypothetical protein
MKNAQELEGDDLLEALGVETAAPDTGGYTPRQERILAGFEDILRFHEKHGRAPQHGQHLDIFERLYAVRLDQLRKLPEEDISLLRPLDRFSLLTETKDSCLVADALSDDELLAALAEDNPDDIGTLLHVQSIESRREAEGAEYIAERTKCEDFDLYRPLFAAAEADLAAGRRVTKPFEKDASIEQGDFFILDGQMVYVAAVGETFKTVNADTQGRLRAIYSNGTESNILLRSLQRALYEEHRNGRRVTTPDLGPLFGGTLEDGDVESGTIYVLRSLSTQPELTALQGGLFKIGVTGGRVEDRIANAQRDPTFLLAPVEIVAQWKLANIHRFRLEKLLHRVLGPAQLRLSAPARFGGPVEPREWFVVPLSIINEVIERISDGTLIDYVYDPVTGSLVKPGIA